MLIGYRNARPAKAMNAVAVRIDLQIKSAYLVRARSRLRYQYAVDRFVCIRDL